MDKAIILMLSLLLPNSILAGEILVNFQPINELASGDVQDGTKMAKGTIQYTGSQHVSFFITDIGSDSLNNEIKLASITRPGKFIFAKIEGDGWFKSKDKGFINAIKSQAADFYLVTSGNQKISSDRWRINLSVGISEYR